MYLLSKYVKCSVWRLDVRYDLYIYIYTYLCVCVCVYIYIYTYVVRRQRVKYKGYIFWPSSLSLGLKLKIYSACSTVTGSIVTLTYVQRRKERIWKLYLHYCSIAPVVLGTDSGVRTFRRFVGRIMKTAAPNKIKTFEKSQLFIEFTFILII